MLDRIRVVHDRVEGYVLNLAIVGLFGAMAMVTISSVSRYIFNAPIGETKPIAELYFMIMIFFLITPRMQRLEQNIKVTSIYDRLTERKQNAIDVVSRLMGLATYLPILYISLGRTWNGYVTNWWTTGAVHVPVYLSYALMSLGLLMLAIRLLVQLGDDIAELAGLAHIDTEPSGAGQP